MVLLLAAGLSICVGMGTVHANTVTPQSVVDIPASVNGQQVSYVPTCMRPEFKCVVLVPHHAIEFVHHAAMAGTHWSD